ncbi:hypothetical protein M9H77_32519 [Catharanthus roseus]|uniref:Uncharacterized protein n=1 Tax=Catharanthus roseus TaxID=4058 RepID=A0ACC0A363_CATRO|nr:hypothetical protein M9H77_32519 [Catharanthus roseus]
MVVQSEVLPNCRMVVQSEEVPGDVLPNCDMVVQSEEVPGDVLPNCDMEVQLEEVPNIASPKLDETVISNILVKPEEKAASAADNANPEDETVIDLDEVQKRVIDNNTVSLEENAHPSGNNVPASIEEVILPSNSTENHCAADRNEEEEEEETMPEPETKFGSLVLSEEVPSSKACEVEMVESVESGSVNLSRIHHSPESTH